MSSAHIAHAGIGWSKSALRLIGQLQETVDVRLKKKRNFQWKAWSIFISHREHKCNKSQMLRQAPWSGMEIAAGQTTPGAWQGSCLTGGRMMDVFGKGNRQWRESPPWRPSVKGWACSGRVGHKATIGHCENQSGTPGVTLKALELQPRAPSRLATTTMRTPCSLENQGSSIYKHQNNCLFPYFPNYSKFPLTRNKFKCQKVWISALET